MPWLPPWWWKKSIFNFSFCIHLRITYYFLRKLRRISRRIPRRISRRIWNLKIISMLGEGVPWPFTRKYLQISKQIFGGIFGWTVRVQSWTTWLAHLPDSRTPLIFKSQKRLPDSRTTPGEGRKGVGSADEGSRRWGAAGYKNVVCRVLFLSCWIILTNGCLARGGHGWFSHSGFSFWFWGARNL